ncbi:MAG: type II toxin-antitoxin system RelB/DinJ family antitoxin [Coriobacteriia bacterium]|nr:type II toxin-antitoxin system RelB/DinJ family antitoxin [Coriobacteriia bacterium]
MATIQVRIDDKLKKEAVEVFENLGMDLSTAIRVFLKRSVIEKGVPFEMKNVIDEHKMKSAIARMNAKSKELGNDKLSLDEINEIISNTRKRK